MKYLRHPLKTLVLIPIIAVVAGTGCSTFKATYDWEFYSREACKAEIEGWTRNKLRSSFPNALVLGHTVLGVNHRLGVIGQEIWRIDSEFVAEIQFAYRVNIPGGEFVPVKDLIIEPAPHLSLPESRPDDRVVAVRILRQPARMVEQTVYVK